MSMLKFSGSSRGITAYQGDHQYFSIPSDHFDSQPGKPHKMTASTSLLAMDDDYAYMDTDAHSYCHDADYLACDSASLLDDRDCSTATPDTAPSLDAGKDNFTKSRRKCDEIKMIDQSFDDLFRCQKIILKHIIAESLINEKVHPIRYALLPESCKQPFLIFFREAFGWEMPKFSQKVQSPSSIAINHISTQSTTATKDLMFLKFRDVAFKAECYVYGVTRQLAKVAFSVTDHIYVYEAIHNSLTKSQGQGSFKDLSEFVRMIEVLMNYEFPEDPNAFLLSIPHALLKKFAAIAPEVLAKFYKIKVKNTLNVFLDRYDNRNDLLAGLGEANIKIDLFSNYFENRKVNLEGKYKLLSF